MAEEPPTNLLDPKETTSIFLASPMKTAQYLKTPSYFYVESSENLNKDISLASKATLMPLTDVTISPTRKRSRTNMMMQEPLMTLLDGFRWGYKPKELSLFPASSVKADENLKTHYLIDVESSENPREELKEDAKKIKKMKYRSNKEMEIDLNIPPYTFTKKLSASDIGQLCRLMLERTDAENHILSHLSADDNRRIQEGIGLKLKVYDNDTKTEHDLVLKRMVRSTNSYVINGRWVTEFVKRKGLEEGQKLGLFWNAMDYRLHIFLLSPAPADQKNHN